MSQPDPSPTQAPSWPQPSLGSKKPPLQHTDLRCSSYQNKLWHCFLQLCPFLCKPHHCLADVESAMQQPRSTCLPLYLKRSLPLPLPPWHGVRASCSTALNLFYPVYVASLFLEIHSCGCLKFHRRKNLLELSLCLPSCFIGKGQIIISSSACSTVSHCLLWHDSGGKKSQHLLFKCMFISETVEWERAELIFLVFKNVPFP